MLELLQLIERTIREKPDLAGVNFVPGNREDNVTGIDQSPKHRDQ